MPDAGLPLLLLGRGCNLPSAGCLTLAGDQTLAAPRLAGCQKTAPELTAIISQSALQSCSAATSATATAVASKVQSQSHLTSSEKKNLCRWSQPPTCGRIDRTKNPEARDIAAAGHLLPAAATAARPGCTPASAPPPLAGPSALAAEWPSAGVLITLAAAGWGGVQRSRPAPGKGLAAAPIASNHSAPRESPLALAIGGLQVLDVGGWIRAGARPWPRPQIWPASVRAGPGGLLSIAHRGPIFDAAQPTGSHRAPLPLLGVRRRPVSNRGITSSA
ncbi:hypothetical protein EDC01DRAFT_745169 [Geopyxis carbonaria]|nr:hypothetical protein EDC01DRAFT_745169 [Geopyxis carbonaria]